MAILAVAVTACGSAAAGASGQGVPKEFRHACGHPGATVTVRHVPVTVKHSACDLTGVRITVPRYGGAAVPATSGRTGNGDGFSITVASGSHDVTIDATGSPGIG
jgi:hypothetical protein